MFVTCTVDSVDAAANTTLFLWACFECLGQLHTSFTPPRVRWAKLRWLDCKPNFTASMSPSVQFPFPCCHRHLELHMWHTRAAVHDAAAPMFEHMIYRCLPSWVALMRPAAGNRTSVLHCHAAGIPWKLQDGRGTRSTSHDVALCFMQVLLCVATSTELTIACNY